MKKTASLLIALAFAGCATTHTPSLTPSASFAAKATMQRDDFRKSQLVVGMSVSDLPLGAFKHSLRAFKEDSKPDVSYSVVIDSMRGFNAGWAFWGSAVDSDGKELPFAKIGSETGDGGMTFERCAIGLTREYLEQRKASGIRLRVDGKRAQQEFTITGAEVDGFLQAVDSKLPK